MGILSSCSVMRNYTFEIFIDKDDSILETIMAPTRFVAEIIASQMFPEAIWCNLQCVDGQEC